MAVTEIHGVCDERFEPVRKALAESLNQDDVGASAAVYVDGEPVADLWGGYADAARTIAWERDTITNVWSTTKTMLARLSLANPGVRGGRGHPPDHRPVPGRLLRRGGGRAARR